MHPLRTSLKASLYACTSLLSDWEMDNFDQQLVFAFRDGSMYLRKYTIESYFQSSESVVRLKGIYPAPRMRATARRCSEKQSTRLITSVAQINMDRSASSATGDSSSVRLVRDPSNKAV